MSKIKLLPPEIYNKIAAGEVVERPSSVIRELIENSYDAGADDIIINIENYGFDKIEIIDNGEGMSEQDILLASKKHATSKIDNFDDIYNSKFLGFRGEAIPSILSVSKTEIISSNNDDGLGINIKFESENVIDKQPVRRTRGTTITVKDLFFNTPARKKFLKSNRSELINIKKQIINNILAINNTGITLNIDNKQEFKINKNFSLKDKIAVLFKKNISKNLIFNKTDFGNFEISGYITNETYFENSSRNEFIIINKRIINNSTIFSAIRQAYTGIIPKGKYPCVFLNIKFPDGFVDFNVHPQKKEVRFNDNNIVFKMVHNFILSTLRNKSQNTGDILYSADSNLLKYNEIRIDDNIDKNSRKTGKTIAENNLNLFEYSSGNTKQEKQENEINIQEITTTINQKPNSVNKRENTFDIRIIGQFANSFIIYERNNILYIADQHALHERINYEELKLKFNKKSFDTQYLLIPVIIERDKLEADIIKKHLNIFKQINLKIEEFSGNSFKIEEIPDFIPKGKETELINEYLDFVIENKNISKEIITDNLLKLSACKKSVKFGDKLNPVFMQNIIEQMYDKNILQTCPHGRRYIKEISFDELKKFFER